jgi:hypothetical protein
VHLWDTGTRSQAGDLTQQKGWRRVTAAAPGKLQGDLVVQTGAVSAGFASRLGKVLVDGAAIRPVELGGKQAKIAATTVSERDGVLTVRADFRAADKKTLPISLSFT